MTSPALGRWLGAGDAGKSSWPARSSGTGLGSCARKGSATRSTATSSTGPKSRMACDALGTTCCFAKGNPDLAVLVLGILGFIYLCRLKQQKAPPQHSADDEHKENEPAGKPLCRRDRPAPRVQRREHFPILTQGAKSTSVLLRLSREPSVKMKQEVRPDVLAHVLRSRPEGLRISAQRTWVWHQC